MNELSRALFTSIVPIFVLVMMGYAIRRLGAVGSRGTDGLSKIVLLILFPILVFHRLAVTDDAQTMLTDWPILVWPFVVLIGSGLIGWLWHRVNRLRADLRTFVFLVGMPNWIYIPLALAGPIWGDEAVRLIILFNIPTQLLLWTVGIWLLKGDLRGVHALRYLCTSPGLLAAVGGVLVAFQVIPISFSPDHPGFSLARLNPVLHVLGGLTIPLSLFALGLYVGERAETPGEVFVNVIWVGIGRLIIAPLAMIFLVVGLAKLGYGANPMIRWVVYLIATMPVAVSVPLFAAMFGRDRFLASRSVVVTTMVGFLTAPLLVLFALKLETWLGIP
ncbi:MAG TPA: AEC family transporter [Kiritimatiellia bacterium]|nr:AEC family transporter [Kiritimatiellia bacterium]HMO99311.1 AEC family transporter [Kiritimatiellia bacterium]HMP95643.1 AEC family transporter [Kiritimatiellia bacterium]